MEQPEIKSHENIYEMISNQDELSWQSIILDLVRTNQMDPWNIDVSLLTKTYIAKLKELQNTDFQLTGRVIIAAALLLKIKSNRLVGEDLNYLDSLFAQKDDEIEGFDDFDAELGELENYDPEKFPLIPRTPGARKRKVSIYDLIDALQKAMEVKKRRVLRDMPVLDFKPPSKIKDVTQIIKEVYLKLRMFLAKNKKATFRNILPKDATKEDIVFTFIPLLHLSNHRKIDLTQEEHFGDIHISVPSKVTKDEAENDEKESEENVQESNKVHEVQ